MHFNVIKKIIFCVLGASRGIGREMAIQLSKLFTGGDSTFILIARNEVELNKVKQEILRK